MLSSLTYQDDVEVSCPPFFHCLSAIKGGLMLDLLLSQICGQDILVDWIILDDQDIDWRDHHGLLALA